MLKGLEPVKQRPGMYTRTDNPLHIVQEVIDNAADEALAGYGKKIKRHAAHRWLGQRRRRWPGHSLWPAPRRKRPGGRAGLHPPARGRQVRQGQGRRLQLLGRPARRGRERDQCAVHPPGSDQLPRGRRWPAWSLPVAMWSSPCSAARCKAASASRAPPCAPGPMPATLTARTLPHGRAGPPAAQQGRADAGRVASPWSTKKPRDTQTWQYKGGLRRLPEATLTADPLIPLFEGEGFADSAGRQLCRRRRRRLVPWPSPKKARRCARATST